MKRRDLDIPTGTSAPGMKNKGNRNTTTKTQNLTTRDKLNLLLPSGKVDVPSILNKITLINTFLYVTIISN